MDNYTFQYFWHFSDEMLPPWADKSAPDSSRSSTRWQTQRLVVSLGNIRHSDDNLATFDDEYNSLRAADYM